MQQGPGWLELSEMTEQPDYDLETFVNKAESALSQQAKHFSALRGGCSWTSCGWRMGPLRMMVALPCRNGASEIPTNTSVPPPLPSRCHQGLAPGHAAGRAGQQTNKQQETAPVTTANKDVWFHTQPFHHPTPPR